MREVNFTREEFHQLVWQESLPSLSKKYDISYYELRKKCNELNIPLPKSGYWENRRLGKKVTIEPLSVSSKAVKTIKLELLEEGDVRKVIEKKLKRDALTNIDLPTVSSRLSNPDKLVVAAQISLNRKEASYGHYSGVVSTERNVLDIRVAPSSVSRALRFMDTFIKILRSRGNSISFENDITNAVINGEEIRIFIREMTKRTLVKHGTWERTDMLPTSELSFRMGRYSEVVWKDGKQTLEEQLPKILERLESESEKEKKEREEREKWHAEYEEKRRIELEVQKLKEKETSDFKQLLGDAERWHQSKIVREYLDAIEIKITDEKEILPDLKKWLTWARERINNYDPINNIG